MRERDTHTQGERERERERENLVTRNNKALIFLAIKGVKE